MTSTRPGIRHPLAVAAAIVLVTALGLEAPASGAKVITPSPMAPDVPSTATTNNLRFVWGAVGDSYASGEGNPEAGISNPNDIGNFTGLSWGDDTSITLPNGGASRTGERLTCHRSDNAGAPKAHRALQARYPGVTFVLGFVACSGAQTEHLIDTNYTGPNTRPESLRGYSRVTQPPQLQRISALRTAQNGQLDALYMSIGGNDMGFGEIMSTCLTPFSNCASDFSDEMEQRQSDLIEDYDDLKGEIVDRFGEELPVLISKYPNPLHDGAGNPPVCQGNDYNEHFDDWFDDPIKDEISPEEAAFAYTIPATLNAAVAAGAGDDWRIVDDHLPNWNFHGVCTDAPYANLNSVALHRQGHDTADTFTYTYSNGFMHPNDAGFSQYGTAITNELVPLVNAKVGTGLAVATNLRIAAAPVNGNLTVRWRDRSKAENSYDIEVVPNRTVDRTKIVVPNGATTLGNGGFRLRLNGQNVQQYVHAPTGGGQFRYRVRPCYTGVSTGSICGDWTAFLVGTNVTPTVPASPRFTTTPIIVNGQIVGFQQRYEWNAQVGTIEYVVRRTPRSTSVPALADVRQTSTAMNIGIQDRANYSFRVAACNRAGCSGFTTAM